MSINIPVNQSSSTVVTVSFSFFVHLTQSCLIRQFTSLCDISTKNKSSAQIHSTSLVIFIGMINSTVLVSHLKIHQKKLEKVKMEKKEDDRRGMERKGKHLELFLKNFGELRVLGRGGHNHSLEEDI